MATNPELGRDVYLALAAVGWVDGQLTRAAADAIVRAARDEGLAPDALAEIEAATRQPQDIGVFDRLKLSKSDRLYVYAVASWTTHFDERFGDAERAALATLGQAIGVLEAPRRHVDGMMREVAAAGRRPERFDLLAVRRMLDEELQSARAARIAAVVQAKTPADP